jgi:hypothetical protein
MLSVNDELMSLNGSAVRTSEIGERILSAINREFEKPLKAVEPAAQSGEAPVQKLKDEILPIAAQALIHCSNYNREAATELLNKLTAKLSAA